ncbi:hypothetical protein [Ascidiimonas aurantiaca]|uniref:hypothetical protein n=1 Tax=Ascidiimonas aurantiaca TaxID=1685432 RepID=UPI0030EE6C2F
MNNFKKCITIFLTLISSYAISQDLCYTKTCLDDTSFKIEAHSGKNYTKIKVIEQPNGPSWEANTNNLARNSVATINGLQRGKRYLISVSGRNRIWWLWSERCFYNEFIPLGVFGDISSNKSKYCEDEQITIRSNLNNNSSVGNLTVRKNGNDIFTTTKFSYNNPIDLKQVLSTPNNYGNTLNLTTGNYSIIFSVEESNSTLKGGCSKFFFVNFEITSNSLKEPLVTFNHKDTSLINIYTIYNICNSRNNDGVLLRVSRNIALNECERIDEKILIAISTFDTITGNSSNTQSIVYNFPYENLTFVKLKDIFPTYNFSNDITYKMVISGQTYYFKMNSWNDCLSVSNPRLNPRANLNRIRN